MLLFLLFYAFSLLVRKNKHFKVVKNSKTCKNPDFIRELVFSCDREGLGDAGRTLSRLLLFHLRVSFASII